MDRVYHWELMWSKKMVKDYELVHSAVREVVCYALGVVEKGMRNWLQMMVDRLGWKEDRVGLHSH